MNVNKSHRMNVNKSHRIISNKSKNNSKLFKVYLKHQCQITLN